MPRAIVLHRADNVAALIDSGRVGEICALQGESNRPHKVGEHIHIHNVESARGRGDQAGR